MFKHKLKLLLLSAYARVLFHGGLHALVDRLMPRRLTILAGHCVDPGNGAWPAGGHLPADMKISSAKLERIALWFARRYRMVTIGQGVEALANGDRQSLVALSMDDGYRDNHAVMLPLLARHGIPATVFLESRPLDERRVNWSHKLFWILARLPMQEFTYRYGQLSGDPDLYHAIHQLATEDRGRVAYHVKRALKYDADPADRERVIDAIFVEQGGDEAALCEALYMTWDEARELRDAGFELGGHTVTHAILSRLPPAEAELEIGEGARALQRELGAQPATFAYPWGRLWDFDDASREAVRGAGFRTAVTMHAGTNDARTEPTRFLRLAIDDSAELHLLAAEACGGFDLLRRLGIKL